MDSQDREVLATLLRWHQAGHRSVLVTLARTWGSAPREAGAWLALRDDSALSGAVSGGCVEDDLIERLRDGRLMAERPYILRYGETPDEARRFGLPCGGALELVVEPNPDIALLGRLAESSARGEIMRRVVDLDSARVSLQAGNRGDTLQWDGRTLHSLHGPRRRLLLIGAGPISRVLAQMAPALDFAVFVCDPREEFAAEWNSAQAPLLPGMPDDVVTELKPDANTAIVALTHDPKLDDMALLEALKSQAFYVGALGSRLNNARRRERLQEHFDLTYEQITRLHGPVGLPIGSRTPPEIAVSILAHIIAEQRANASCAVVSADMEPPATALSSQRVCRR